jgi:hypothetical protein
MTIHFFDHDNVEAQKETEALRRQRFIERMERKLEFKQSLRHPHYHRYLIR